MQQTNGRTFQETVEVITKVAEQMVKNLFASAQGSVVVVKLCKPNFDGSVHGPVLLAPKAPEVEIQISKDTRDIELLPHRQFQQRKSICSRRLLPSHSNISEASWSFVEQPTSCCARKRLLSPQPSIHEAPYDGQPKLNRPTHAA